MRPEGWRQPCSGIRPEEAPGVGNTIAAVVRLAGMIQRYTLARGSARIATAAAALMRPGAHFEVRT